MNKRQKLVQKQFLNDEEKILKDLKNIYNQATEDITKKSKELQEQIKDIQSLIDNTDDEKELERLKSMHQSKVYQKQYQDALKKQIGGILDNMQVEEFKTVSAYLNKCYEEAFLGTLYDMQGQGIPLCFPIDQQAMVQAVQLDSKISNGLYSSIGENVAELKKTITSEVSRGIATGATFPQIAKQIQSRMTGVYTNKTGGALYRAELIARTEGHRIQCQSTMNACYEAKDRGADIVKQWDSTLDGDTRPSHRQVDGEIKELDEKFSNGLMFPGDPSGGAAEVCNCRCALLERARWAINAGFTKMNNFTKQLETFESPEDYNEFKKAFFSKENRDFMNYHTDLEKQYGTKNFEKLLGSMTDDEYKKYMELYGKSPIYNKAAGKKKEALTNSSKSGKIQMGTKDVRKWYIEEVSKIVDNIDKTLPIEQRAKQAFEARNTIRTEARDLMLDQKTRKMLDKEHPNKTFEELVESKMKRKGMTREEAIQDVYDTATKTNASVNKDLGIKGD